VQVRDSVLANARTVPGVRVVDGEDVTLEGNTIEGLALGTGIDLDTCDGCVVSGNTVRSLDEGAGVDAAACTTCTLSGNTVHNLLEGHGIVVDGCVGCTLSDNEVHTLSGGQGLRVLNSTGTTLSGNLAHGLGGSNPSGLVVSGGADLLLAGNTAHGLTAERDALGIVVGSVQGATVTGSTVHTVDGTRHVAGVRVTGAPSVAVTHTLVHGVTGGADGHATCVWLTDARDLGLGHLTCHGVGSAGTSNGFGVRLDAGAPTQVSLRSGVVTEASGYALWSHGDNPLTQLSAVFSDFFACGQGVAYNAYLGASTLQQDPQYLDPAGGDLRLFVESPLLDLGDPEADWCPEPEPNGCRVNIGRYGGTLEATSAPGADHCPCE